ncbi:polysaccharide deacetylase family protein [Aestuariicella hydrocarbonica]|uniref:Polysaccharide deacetylase family protein n=1 Tax=Pseudomaricurvus hydrocarbonicus TaxID=1470433 RepID=A0A9E5MLC9_9GAMM|nr:polysaccharide deacetylase family protein [Aestuariicella hydrocarbonica]NHO64268.1 polysaccharide deacetylase family protein [Aestuariicella hydrocarbonica]
MMAGKVNSTGWLLACSLSLGLLWSGLSAAAVVLQYHHVSDETPASTSTPVALFRRHLEILAEQGYQVVPLPELLQRYADTPTQRLRQVAITFDDGYLSVYTEAFPALQKRGWPFTVFVNTRPIDERWHEFVSWEQLREMAEQGATIANHTVDHAHMIRLRQGESRAQWRQRITTDVLQAEMRIETETGQSHRILAYPYGEYDLHLVALLKSLKFVGFGQHSGPLGTSHSPQALPRFPFGGVYGAPENFVVKAGSLPLPVKRLGRDGQWSRGDLEPVLETGNFRPSLMLELAGSVPANRVHCFASGQDGLRTEVSGQRITVHLSADLPLGRSRINCTAAADDGRFYWYSQPFFRADHNGDWPPE